MAWRLARGVTGACLLAAGIACAHAETSPDPRFERGALLFADDFREGLKNWLPELESGGRVDARDGLLRIDVPAGATVWFRPRLEGPVLIEYDARVTTGRESDDRVSDLNCFWMAHETKTPAEFPGGRRSGKFADYNTLLTYYVGLGGNGNTTTRFRRYVGDPVKRPLLPGHDLAAPAALLAAGKWQHIQILAAGRHIQFHRDGVRLFDFDDSAPYEAGWFAFRTVTSRQEYRRFRVYRLVKAGHR